MERIPSHRRVLSVLPELLDDLAKTSSPATVRQREWAIHQALEHHARTTGSAPDLRALSRVRLEEVLAPVAVESYLQAASAGRLRHRSSPARPESPRSTAARAVSLRWLAGHTDIPSPAPAPDATPLVEPTPRLARHLRLALIELSASGLASLQRSAAALAVVACTAARSTDLIELATSDLDLQPGRYTLPAPNLHPQPATFTSDGTTVRAVMPYWAREPLRVWLDTRAHLVAALQGADPRSLFVTCHSNNRKEPPGLPVSVRGLTAGYAAARRWLDTRHPQLDPPRTLAVARRVALANFLSSPPAL